MYPRNAVPRLESLMQIGLMVGVEFRSSLMQQYTLEHPKCTYMRKVELPYMERISVCISVARSDVQYRAIGEERKGK